VQLNDLYVDGLLPLSSIRNEFFEFRAERHELVGRNGTIFRLADEIEVTLAEVDLPRRRLLLGLAGVPDGAPGGTPDGTRGKAGRSRSDRITR
jgi:exoribonuclease R